MLSTFVYRLSLAPNPGFAREVLLSLMFARRFVLEWPGLLLMVSSAHFSESFEELADRAFQLIVSHPFAVLICPTSELLVLS